jgi:hypothetical protein
LYDIQGDAQKGKTKQDLYIRLVNGFGSAWETSATDSRKKKIPHFRNSICCAHCKNLVCPVEMSHLH